jgi:spore coat polysaccharide biosynthesis protein SpsF
LGKLIENKLNIVTVMQVRCGSTRLPNKVLLPIISKPLFFRQVERILSAELKGTVVVSTTTCKEDDEIENICIEEGIYCYRGSSEDLLDRHFQTAKFFQADTVIKIPSDCPLIDPAIIGKVITYFINNEGKYDYVSNLHPATYPDGNDVEIMKMKALSEAWKYAARPLEREHTTPYLWENPNKFRIGNVELGGNRDYSMSHRWTIDYKEDYEFINRVYDALYPVNPLFGMKDIIELLERQPELMNINGHLAGVNWYRNHLDELRTVTKEQTKVIAI